MIDNNLISKYVIRDGTPKSSQCYYAEMIQASEKVRIDINKENDPLKMLDKTLLCIYFLTGDKIFYEENRKKLIKFIAEFDYKI